MLPLLAADGAGDSDDHSAAVVQIVEVAKGICCRLIIMRTSGPKNGVGERSQTLFERCLHVLTLSSLAVAQPLLDVLADNGELLIAHHFSPSDVAFLIVSAVFLMPLPGLVVEWFLARAPRAVATAGHGLIIAFLAGLFWVLALKRSGLLSGHLVMALAALGAVLTAALYLWARWVRIFATFLAVSLIAVPAVFLSSPHIVQILSARDPESSMDSPAVDGAAVVSAAPIVFIVFDELATSVLLDERHEINPHRYPAFAALAGQSTWFANAVSVAEITNSAMPAIVTGNYPRAEKLPTFSEYPDNLFTLFGDTHDVWAQEPITELCPPQMNLQDRPQISRSARLMSIFYDLSVVYLQVILPEPYTAKLPSISGKWRDFGVSQGEPLSESNWFARSQTAIRRDRRAAFDRLASTLGESSRPALYFLHVLLPHRPWEFLPSGHSYPGGEYIPGLGGTLWQDNEYLVQQAYQRYILQMRYVDAAIGRIVRRLEEEGLFDRSLIVLLGDHGTSFRTGDDRRLVNEANDQDIVPVPLLIKAPGQTTGRVVSHQVRIIDVLPTMLDLLEIEAPWPMSGRSGFDASPRDAHFVTKERGTFEIDPAIHRQKYDTVRWKLERFGNGEDPVDLYRFGPAGHLVGRRVDEVTSREPVPPAAPTWTAQLDYPERYQEVTPGDGIPVLVTGTIAGSQSESCCRLAVAVNGRVAATVQSHFETGSGPRFSAMIPADVLRESASQIELYEIADGDVLLPLRPERGAGDHSRAGDGVTMVSAEDTE